MADKSVLLTGGTGFIGQVLSPELLRAGYKVDVLSRQKPEAVQALCGRVTPISELSAINGGPGYDVVINLAGEGIAEKRWSEARKQSLRDSRIALTRELVTGLLSCERLPEVMVSGSAVGYYGAQGGQPVTETTTPKDEFSHRLCADWEHAASPLSDKGVRVCYSRTGVVVGRDGGFLDRMLLPFRLGLGGRIGSGEQYMPWVHRQDVVRAIQWMVETDSAAGAYNVVSPNPVSNRAFTRTLADVLGRPALFPVPATVLKLALGEMSQLLLTGQKALPERLQTEGFEFLYPDLDAALREAVGKPG
ncbi:TIGR01777 family oxidoreductase [Marinobacter bryozoorum]|uniref:TIGR01777 family oxidoreductase n=1 Tax=Marinobacter bryozoorum TaxID=256324 RepID=UPI0020045B2B|nr:TIGR01777 family oxidoreductase [Marinobacter bryozoorum]MCK7543188.1 TIGR01777 family oxidoreductase [Marinobacter bryozoorum]